MKLPARLLVKLSPLVEAVRGEPLAEPSLRVSAQSEHRLQVDSELGRFSFDLLQRTVDDGTGRVLSFDQIQSVDVGAFPGGRGQPSWSVSLYLGPLNSVPLGRTYDDGDASVIAAKLARRIGCKVVAVSVRR